MYQLHINCTNDVVLILCLTFDSADNRAYIKHNAETSEAL
jgi:hypothetical protein